MSGRRVDLTTADGAMDSYTFRPATEKPLPAVIVYMDAFGIRPDLDSMAQRLADAGYFVIVPNLYYRSGAFEPFDPRKVFGGDEAERVRFRGMIDSLDNTAVMRDTAAVLEYLARTPEVRQPEVGVVGYCMGGGFAISALGRFPDRVVAAASFHGAALASDKADSPHLLARQMRGKLLCRRGGNRPRVSGGAAGTTRGSAPRGRRRLHTRHLRTGQARVRRDRSHGLRPRRVRTPLGETPRIVQEHAAASVRGGRVCPFIREA